MLSFRTRIATASIYFKCALIEKVLLSRKRCMQGERIRGNHCCIKFMTGDFVIIGKKTYITRYDHTGVIHQKNKSPKTIHAEPSSPFTYLPGIKYSQHLLWMCLDKKACVEHKTVHARRKESLQAMLHYVCDWRLRHHEKESSVGQESKGCRRD